MIFPSGARVLVLNEKKQLLIAQRQDLHTWGFPGGRIEKGETPEETVIRETKEETGVRIKVERLLAVYFRTHFLAKGVTFLFLGKKIGGREKREVGETLEVKWVSREKLKNYVNSWSLEACKQAFSSDKKIKFDTISSFPVTFSKIPVFIWRRTIGKKLGLVRLIFLFFYFHFFYKI
ncbi:MAG TPA: NUDIX domain-containing protein [Clostridia bacterium]|nr:NUDIX domain-containing protein [Clostridia bacterium]